MRVDRHRHQPKAVAGDLVCFDTGERVTIRGCRHCSQQLVRPDDAGLLVKWVPLRDYTAERMRDIRRAVRRRLADRLGAA